MGLRIHNLTHVWTLILQISDRFSIADPRDETVWAKLVSYSEQPQFPCPTTFRCQFTPKFSSEGRQDRLAKPAMWLRTSVLESDHLVTDTRGALIYKGKIFQDRRN